MTFEPLESKVAKNTWVANLCKNECIIGRVLVYRFKSVWFFELHDWRTYPKTIQKYELDLTTETTLNDVFKTVQENVKHIMVTWVRQS